MKPSTIFPRRTRPMMQSPKLTLIWRTLLNHWISRPQNMQKHYGTRRPDVIESTTSTCCRSVLLKGYHSRSATVWEHIGARIRELQYTTLHVTQLRWENYTGRPKLHTWQELATSRIIAEEPLDTKAITWKTSKQMAPRLSLYRHVLHPKRELSQQLCMYGFNSNWAHRSFILYHR